MFDEILRSRYRGHYEDMGHFPIPSFRQADMSGLPESSEPLLFVCGGVGFPTTYRIISDKVVAVPATTATGVGNCISPDGQWYGRFNTGLSSVDIHRRIGDRFLFQITAPAMGSISSGCGAFSPDGIYLACGIQNAPRFVVFRRVSANNFVRIPDPASVMGNSASSLAWSLDGRYLLATTVVSPYLFVYRRYGDILVKLPDPATLPANGPGVPGGIAQSCNGVAISRLTPYIAIGGSNVADSPSFTIYRLTSDGPFKLGTPATMPTGPVQGVAFSPDENYLAVSGATSPFIYIYRRDGDVFTKIADPLVIPAGQPSGIAFSPDNNYLVVGHATTPFLRVYRRHGDEFTALDAPGTLPGGTVQSVCFAGKSPAFSA